MYIANLTPLHLAPPLPAGGCMRMTVCTCVMLLELTNNLALLPLVMLVLLVAKAVGDGTGVKPTYEAQIDVKDFPYLEQHPERFLRHITARWGLAGQLGLRRGVAWCSGGGGWCSEWCGRVRLLWTTLAWLSVVHCNASLGAAWGCPRHWTRMPLTLHVQQ